MSKIYKGYELIKAIADGEIKEGSKIEIKGRFSGALMGSYFIYNEGSFYFPIYKPDGTKYDDKVEIHDIINFRFELIEDNTIDIDSIEEIEAEAVGALSNEVKSGLNKTIQAVKQLNKEIKELKEK